MERPTSRETFSVLCLDDKKPLAIDREIVWISGWFDRARCEIGDCIWSRERTINEPSEDTFPFEAVGGDIGKIVCRDLLPPLPVSESGSRTGRVLKKDGIR
jgi:hypothetical protein